MESPAVEPGQQVAIARKIRGQNQGDLANALSRYTNGNWTRQKVSDLENGAKTFTVEILRALSDVQGFRYEFYLDGFDSTLGGNTGARAGGAIPRYVKPKKADVIDIKTRQRIAN